MISVVIVDFFKSERVSENIKKTLCEGVASEQIEIIIVDNSCCQKNAETLRGLERKFPSFIKLRISDRNEGYTKAYNSGVSIARGDVIVILNPDVYISSTDFFLLRDKIKADRHVGILSVNQVNDDGSIPEVARRFPSISRQFFSKLSQFGLVSLPIKEAYNIPIGSKEVDVPWAQSSFYCMRAEVWDELDGFDERFFLFMSDPDICYRVWDLGLRVVVSPEVCVVADGKRCSDYRTITLPQLRILWIHLVDSLKFQLKAIGKGWKRYDSCV